MMTFLTLIGPAAMRTPIVDYARPPLRVRCAYGLASIRCILLPGIPVRARLICRRFQLVAFCCNLLGRTRASPVQIRAPRLKSRQPRRPIGTQTPRTTVAVRHHVCGTGSNAPADTARRCRSHHVRALSGGGELDNNWDDRVHLPSRGMVRVRVRRRRRPCGTARPGTPRCDLRRTSTSTRSAHPTCAGSRCAGCGRVVSPPIS
jgi:hypothetical protein